MPDLSFSREEATGNKACCALKCMSLLRGTRQNFAACAIGGGELSARERQASL